MAVPRVSIVTGYYNRAEALRRTIESILGQSFADFELLVFDDGSTDDTADQLAALELEYSDPRFRYISHENKGFTAALADAIAQTQGEYIAIQGSGDVALPDRIARQVELLDTHPGVVAVGCWYENVHESTGVRETHRPDAAKASGGFTTFTHGEMMMRRAAYDAVGGYRTELRLSQLTELGFRLSEHGTFATVPEVLYERRLRADGVTFSPTKIAAQSQYFELAKKLRGLAPEDAEELLQLVRNRGIDHVVPVSGDAVQGSLRHKLVTLSLSGDHAASVHLAGQITPAFDRFIYTAIARIAAVPVLGWVVRRTLSALRELKSSIKRRRAR